VLNATTRSFYPQERAPVPNVEKFEWEATSIHRGVENRKPLPPTKFEPGAVVHSIIRYTDDANPVTLRCKINLEMEA
jgi:hypothetical protein